MSLLEILPCASARISSIWLLGHKRRLPISLEYGALLGIFLALADIE